MFNEKAYGLGANRSVIRELFEYGRKRAAEVGTENVFDFSLGNPSIPAPPQVEAAIREALEEGKKGRGYVIDCAIDADEMVHPMVGGGHHITEFMLY